MKRNILRWWYRLFPFHLGMSEFYAGKFRVLYKDGRKSKPMDYRTAKNYAEIFNGEIIDNF